MKNRFAILFGSVNINKMTVSISLAMKGKENTVKLVSENKFVKLFT